MRRPRILAAKLRRPAVPARRVQRLNLLQKLNEGLENNRQVTLVSAPAGFGKTTCASEWVSGLEGWLAAWITLEAADDDPARFFTYLIAALQQADARLGQELAPVLAAGQIPEAGSLWTYITDDLFQLEARVMLVLDDFQVIQDRFILEVMENLIANLPPVLHLVLLTREDPPLPLARLRANNKLTEVRARDLLFSDQEARRFLHEVMGLSLSPADIDTLEQKTEGWIAGLQLAGLSIRGTDDPTGLIQSLSGNHRHILAYLTEQVLNGQPGETRDFLLQTSILDRLNGDLCDAVTGRSGGQERLESLFNANLFLIPLDDDQRWFRYHHMFADLLRGMQRSQPSERTAALHQRASRWYARNGLVSEAIQHGLAAEDYEQVVELLESHAMEMIMQGFAKTVNGWVQVLPAEWVSRSPRTNLAFAWSLILRGAYTQATAYLERLGTIRLNPLPGGEDVALRAEWQVMQSLILYMQGNITECAEMASQALALAHSLGPERGHHLRGLANYVLASMAWAREDYQRATALFQDAIQSSRAAGNLVAEMMSIISMSEIAFERGQLRLGFEIISQAVERIERSGLVYPISAVIYASLGDAYYQWHRLEEARQNYEHALRLSSLAGSNTVTIMCHVLLSRLSQIEGDLETAAQEIQEAVDRMPVEAPAYLRQEIVAQQVRVYLAQNRLTAARMALQWQDASLPEPPPDGISSADALLYHSMLRVLLYQARAVDDPAGLKPGIKLAGRVITAAYNSQKIKAALETLLLRAQLHAMLGDTPVSSADYAQALEIAEPEAFIAMFVEQGQPVAEALSGMVRRKQLGGASPDYVRRILAAFSNTPGATGAETAAASPDRTEPEALVEPAVLIEPEVLIEPLTRREKDVLRLMTEGLKYEEIAGRLVVSVNTVRYHVKGIYGKLAVNNRTQAVEKARRLHIV